jgi:hypothetical protein
MSIYLRTLADLLTDYGDRSSAYYVQRASGPDLARYLAAINISYRRRYPDVALLASTLHGILLYS